MIVSFFPYHSSRNAPDFRAWSTSLRLEGKTLNLKIWTVSGSPTTLEIREGGRLRSSAQEEHLFYDESIHPYLWSRGGTAFLAYAAFPWTGSGVYASVWKISVHGRSLKPVRELRYADLRRWKQGGIVHELRPAKYATEELERAPPTIGDEKFLDKRFILGYRFDQRTDQFRFLGYRIVPQTYPWPESVRFPNR